MYFNCQKFVLIFIISLLIACSKSNDIKEPVIDNMPELSSSKNILSFILLESGNFCEREISNVINSDIGTIEIKVTNSTNIQLIEPTIEISEGANISQTGAQNFSNPITYTITAEDGSTADYRVEVTSGPTEREILERLYELNPDNTTNWDLNDSDIGNWNGVFLDENGSVERLVLQLNGMVNFPDELSQLCSLDDFVINGNALNEIPSVFFELKSITRLSLVNSGLTSIPDGIGKLENLWELILVVNQIETISPEIGDLENLEFFQIGENQLKTIPPEIGKLSKLKRLSLGTNLLTEIPHEISQLQNLENLSVGYNNLNTIPSTLGELSKLTHLILNDNQITILPLEIGSISSLGQLSLNRNLISMLPAEIGQLSNLNLLDITANPLTSIPQEICDMPANYGTQLFVNNGVTCN